MTISINDKKKFSLKKKECFNLFFFLSLAVVFVFFIVFPKKSIIYLWYMPANSIDGVFFFLLAAKIDYRMSDEMKPN